jgi:Mlc titration factor MtfA (ptsG expression regulator)
VHLVDKTDGDIDGIPAFILEKKYIQPWLQLMQHEIRLINEDKSDIDPYGATNEAEFFAVVSEYFFERPLLLKEKHPSYMDCWRKFFANSL